MQNLTELTRRLVDARVDFVLVGGFAAAAYGVILLTRGVDICCRLMSRTFGVSKQPCLIRTPSIVQGRICRLI